MSDKRKITAWIAAVMMLLSVFAVYSGGRAYAGEKRKRDLVIVSLGDSYSSGEGMEPFYGQDEPLQTRVNNKDWLAHRSILAWPGLLSLEGVGFMSDSKDHWFFVAASGAETYDYYDKHDNEAKFGLKNREGQEKKYNKTDPATGNTFADKAPLLPQKEVWKDLKKKNLKADYVTLTFGGNDLGFTKVATTVLLEGRNDAHSVLAALLLSALNKMKPGGEVRERLKNLYRDVAVDAGSQAKVIVAGYPPLFSDKEWDNAFINPEEALAVNKAISYFNSEVEKITEELQREGYQVHFVSVTKAFRGHEAYSSDPYINPAMDPQTQDIDDNAIVSSYSIHPNRKGILAYARCVQNKIDALEYAREFEEEDTVSEEPDTTVIAEEEPDTGLITEEEEKDTGQEEPPAEPDTGAVYSLYADAMQEYLAADLNPGNQQWKEPMFRGYALRDINQDGTDDLVLVAGDEWNGYDLLRMYTVKDGKLYSLIQDDDAKCEKYAFSGNKIHLWNTMYGSGIRGEAAFTFDPGETRLTLVKAISMNAEKPSKVVCYAVTECEGDDYFYFGDEPGPDFKGEVISEQEYDKGVEGYGFTELDFEPKLLTQDEIDMVRKKSE